MNKQRDSNIELLRILAMLAVVAHHMVNNSGITHLYDYSHPTFKMFWLLFVGMWGKTAINVFILITGYFMCEGCLTIKKVLKLYGQISFYAVVMYTVMGFVGYESFSAKGWIDALAWPFTGVNRGFSRSFIWFYLLIPFYNVLLRALTKGQLFRLCGLLLAMYTISGTIFDNRAVFSYVGWYVTLYFIGAAIRRYPYSWMESNKICMPTFFALLCSSVGFAGFVYLIALKIHRAFINPNHLTEDSHKVFAFLIAVFVFLVFRNLKIGYHKWVNTIAMTSFGVLLIHTANAGVRKLLWGDVLNVVGWWDRPMDEIIGLTLIVPVLVFVCCSVLDWVRIQVVEKPLLKRFQ